VILLALDTSSPAGSVAILRDGRVIGAVSTWTDEAYSSRMFRHVEFLLRELSLDLARIEAFAVASGPGSFTGLRVGLAAIKGWAEVYGSPVVAVSVLEAIAAQSRATTPTVVPVFDARRGEVYFGVYRRQGSSARMNFVAEGEASVATPDDFFSTVGARVGNSTFTVVTPTPEALADGLARAQEGRGAGQPIAVDPIVVETVSNVLAPAVGELAWGRVLAGDFDNSLTLDANYVRRTDAELKWKGPGI
jgi:tRNA threonylcarbamoyladenosine biosynthesis protein TsaB